VKFPEKLPIKTKVIRKITKREFVIFPHMPNQHTIKEIVQIDMVVQARIVA
jgi:hypothetical protein